MQPRRLRALRRKGFSTPPPPITWILSGEGGVGSFSGSHPPTRREGFEAGLQSRRRLQGPRAPPTPRTPPGSPGRRSPGGPPCAPGGGSGGECPPSCLHGTLPPRRGGGRGRWVPRPPSPGGAGRPPGGGGWGREQGGGGGGSARLSGDPALDACLGCDPPPLPPPEAAGLGYLPGPLPGSREGRVRRGGGIGARQPPHLQCWGLEINGRLERQPPRPHPGKPVRETDSLRDPDINAAPRAGRPLAGPRPLRPATPRAPRGPRWLCPGPADGRQSRRGQSPESYRLPEVKLAAPTLPPPEEQAAIARWLSF